MKEPFDPMPLVELARKAHPDKPWLAEALSQCTVSLSATNLMIHFVDPSRPNERNSEWQFRENVLLECPTDGDIVLDVLKDGRVGAIEYLSRVLNEDGRSK